MEAKETIVSISESGFSMGKYSGYDGWIIKTTKQEIKIGISDGQSCCENFGNVVVNEVDNVNDWIGAELTGVSITDAALSTKNIESEMNDTECNMMFVTLATSIGPLQFAMYNSHNGYYGHDARVISEQLTESENL